LSSLRAGGENNTSLDIINISSDGSENFTKKFALLQISGIFLPFSKNALFPVKVLEKPTIYNIEKESPARP
jgi:hypothetical protein